MATTLDSLKSSKSADEELVEYLLLYSRSGARPYIEGPSAPIEVLIPLPALKMSVAEVGDPRQDRDEFP